MVDHQPLLNLLHCVGEAVSVHLVACKRGDYIYLKVRVGVEGRGAVFLARFSSRVAASSIE